MNRNELMQMAAEKAIDELSWKSIEYLFQPCNGLELLIRLDFDGTCRIIREWVSDDSPDAMPFRFRGPYISQMQSIMDYEVFYRKLKQLHENI